MAAAGEIGIVGDEAVTGTNVLKRDPGQHRVHCARQRPDMQRNVRRLHDKPTAPVEDGDGTILALLDVGGERRTDEQIRSEEHTSELQSLMRISYAVFCVKKT